MLEGDGQDLLDQHVEAVLLWRTHHLPRLELRLPRLQDLSLENVLYYHAVLLRGVLDDSTIS